MALANGSDGLWFNKTSSTQTGVREFTRAKALTSTQGNVALITFAHSTYSTSDLALSFWCRMYMYRTDGTADWQSGGWMKGHALWNSSTWDLRMNDQYGMSNTNTTLYSYIDGNATTSLNFRAHLYGATGWSNTVMFNIFCMYSRWDLITISYP